MAALLLAGLSSTPLSAQITPGSTVIHPVQNPPPAHFVPGQMAAAPSQPTLVFDAESKRYEAAPGEEFAPFTFILANVWTNAIVINRVQPSCGCTTVSLPPTPWTLAAGSGGKVQAHVSLAGKMGLITKTISFYYQVMPSNAELIRKVDLIVNIPPPPSLAGNMTEAERKAAVDKAKADSQAIFKGSCAECHANKGHNAFGQDLYAADCGICHESSHRESIVPDLHALKQPADFNYWKTIITFGKPHSLMPAFAAAHGGPLTEAQIVSLATYLDHTISHHFSSVSAKASGSRAAE